MPVPAVVALLFAAEQVTQYYIVVHLDRTVEKIAVPVVVDDIVTSCFALLLLVEKIVAVVVVGDGTPKYCLEFAAALAAVGTAAQTVALAEALAVAAVSKRLNQHYLLPFGLFTAMDDQLLELPQLYCCSCSY